MYGQEINSDYLKGGINENVYLKSFELVSVNWSNFSGNIIEVTVANESGKIVHKITPAESLFGFIDGDSNATAEEKEKRKKKAASDVTTWLRMFIADNYCTREEWNEAMKSVNSFKSLYEACKNLLPENFSSIPARIILTYKNNGYLEIPKHWQTGVFFTTKPEVNLVVSDKITTVRPQQESNEVKEDVGF